MDARDGGGGGDAFASDLMTKADKIHDLAVAAYNQELYYAGMGGGTEAELARLRKEFAWIPQWFEAYTTLPDPAGFQPLIDAMDPVLQVLGQPRAENNVLEPVETAMGGIDNARLRLTHWRGEAREDFLEFSSNWDTLAGNQGMVAFVLKHAMLANQEIFTAARRDLLDIADKTIAALDALGPCGGYSDVKTALSVVAAVAGVASTASTGAGAIALAVVSAGAGLGSSAADDLAKEAEKKQAKAGDVQIGSHHVHGVLENMTTATSRVSSVISDKEQEIIAALTKDLDIVTNLNRSLYVAPRPAVLADLPASRLKDRMEPHP